MTIKSLTPERTPYEQSMWNLISQFSVAQLAVAADGLEEAANRLDFADRWCRYDEARDSRDLPVNLYDVMPNTGAISPNATITRCCALGHLKLGLVRAAGYRVDRYQPGWSATRPFIRLATIARATFDPFVHADDGIATINDNRGRETVQWVLRHAANLARGELNARFTETA